MIPPHGGKLVQRIIPSKKREDLEELPVYDISAETKRELRNIGTGVYSPLQGFMGQNEMESVVKEGRLPNGTPWTLPVLLPVDDQSFPGEGSEVLLDHTALMRVEELFTVDKKAAVTHIFGTDSLDHPGVKRFLSLPHTFAGGSIDLIEHDRQPFPRFNLEPKETRVLFREKGWKTVAGFQTRNPPHTGHESLQKTVLGLVDGIFINPLIGRKKPGDFKDEVILSAYKTMIEHYMPRERAVLSILTTEMRYAGPREAIFHAICRKNFGCTHFIVGRDHAGVGNFYPPEAAIEIFDQYPDLKIKIISIKGDFFYCNRCGHLASERTCPHDESYHIKFSGTKIRELLRNRETPPGEIMRSEVFEALLETDDPFVGE
jgi:sulfate adenylyltransferase